MTSRKPSRRLAGLLSPPEVDRIWDIWRSYYSRPNAIFYVYFRGTMELRVHRIPKGISRIAVTSPISHVSAGPFGAAVVFF